MPRKENQRIALTRRLLQEALLRLLSDNALEDISVTTLCKEAGINRATFYNHYTSPTMLLSEMEKQLVAELMNISKKPTTIDNIADQLEQYCLTLKDNAELMAILVRYHIDRDIADVIATVTAYYEHNRLDVGQTPMDSGTAHLVSTFLYSGAYSLIQEWLIRKIDKTPREIAELILSIVHKEFL